MHWFRVLIEDTHAYTHQQSVDFGQIEDVHGWIEDVLDLNERQIRNLEHLIYAPGENQEDSSQVLY